jgi:two-component system NtrC family sensor kinase
MVSKKRTTVPFEAGGITFALSKAKVTARGGIRLEGHQSTENRGGLMQSRPMKTLSETDYKDQVYYRSLTRKMVGSILLVSIIPLILISASILYYLEASYRQKVLDHLQMLVKKHSSEIDNFLDERLADIRVLATSYGLEELSNENLLEQQLARLDEAYTRVFVDLGVVNSDGVQVSYAGPFKLRRANYSDAHWFKEAIQKDYYISDVFMGLRGLPHFIVTVRRESYGRVWILRATVDFESFNSLVQNIRIGKTGFAFILNKGGKFQTKPRYDMKAFGQLLANLAVSPHSWPKDVHVVERESELGVPTLYIMSRLKGGEWILVYQQSERDAFSAIYHARTIAAAIFLVALVCTVIVTVLISKNMVRRISQADLQKEMMNEQVIQAGKLASIGELAAGIAHEINNPLAIMMEEAGWMEDLLMEEDLKGSKNADEYYRAINQIKRQGRRCKEITHKLLSFARKTDPNEQELQLNAIINEMVALSEQRAKYDNIKMNTDLSPDLPQVIVSPSEIQQVLLNLINNSLDALKEKGGTINISTALDGDNVLIDVEDDGPGIPEANLSRIFDPFFTTKAPGRGTGLGLSICYGIVKKMGGEITAESAVGVGTVFHIRIPRLGRNA